MAGAAGPARPGWELRAAAALATVFLVSASAPDTRAQSTLHLPSRWELATPGLLPQAISVDPGNPGYLFAALKSGGVAVLETGPAAPPREAARISRDDFGGLDAMNLAVRDRRLYVALGDFFAASGSRAGLGIVDVTDPRAPHVQDVWITPAVLKGAAAVVVDGRHAYLGAMTEGVMIFDVLEPHAIRHVTTFRPDIHFPRTNPNAVQHPNVRGLAIDAPWLYVAYDAGGVRVVDIGAPAAPREVGRYVNAGMRSKQQAYNNIVIDGSRAYAAVDYAGLEILDIRNPAGIRQLGWWNPWRAETMGNLWFNSPGHTNQLAFDARRQLVYLSAGDSELQVVAVSDPRRPRLVADYGQPKNGRGTWGVTLADDAAYLTYIEAIVPFRSTWSGIVAVTR